MVYNRVEGKGAACGERVNTVVENEIILHIPVSLLYTIFVKYLFRN